MTTAMKRHAVIATLALFLGNAVQAAVIDPVLDNREQVMQGAPGTPLPRLAAAPQPRIVTPPTHLPELPEPEVFVMMLVGLVLIGYKATRHSSDKFK